MMWFAMLSTGTSFADKVHNAYGSLDLDAHTLRVDATIHFVDATLATKFDEGIKQLRKVAEQMQPRLKALLDGVTVTPAGDTVHVVARTTSEQLSDLTKLSGR